LPGDALNLRACIAPGTVLYPESGSIAVVSVHAVKRH
jgi:hypothetical protein